MNKDMEFAGKKVLLTGGTGGIGKCILEKFIAQGAQVFTTTTSHKKLEEFEQKFTRDSAFIMVCDVAKEADLIVQTALEALGGVDIFVHCAGITRDNLLVRMSDEDWDQVHDLNLKAAFQLTRALISKMKDGRVIYVTSVVGSAGNIGQANYIASKAGLAGLARAIASEYGRKNITVNCVEPGFIDTDMTNALPEAIKEQILSKVPMKRMGKPEEVADCVLFLASSQGSYITGTSLRVNGGMFMG